MTSEKARFPAVESIDWEDLDASVASCRHVKYTIPGTDPPSNS